MGHSTRSSEDFIALLRREGIELLVDIRSYPGSRKYPHFNSDQLASALNAAGIDYLHFPQLGGRRRARTDSRNTGWRNISFRGYADYMETPEFSAALDELVSLARTRRVAIMCAEAVPWRCHRTLVSDALLARGVDVMHILDAGVKQHTLTSFARVSDGSVSYRTRGGTADLFDGEMRR